MMGQWNDSAGLYERDSRVILTSPQKFFMSPTTPVPYLDWWIFNLFSNVKKLVSSDGCQGERIHSWSHFSGEVFLRNRQVGTSFLIMDWGFCVDIMSSLLLGSESRKKLIFLGNPYFKFGKSQKRPVDIEDLPGEAHVLGHIIGVF